MKKILTIIIIFLTMFVSAPVSAYTENACYQCNSHNNVYKWGSNSDADSSCPGGYHKVSGSEMECLNKGASYKSVSCAGFDDIPAALPKFISNIVNLIKILTPIILIIMGMTDFLKSVVANDDKGMNEGKTRLIKRTISGVVVFVVVSIVQLVFSAIGTEDARSVATCINCFVNGNCNGNSSSELYPNFNCSDLTQDKCWGFDSNGDACAWYEGACIRAKDKPDTSGCREYTTKEECNGLHMDKLCKWSEEENWCSYGGIPVTCENMGSGSQCDGQNDDYGNVCAWVNGKCIIDNKTNCSDYNSKSTCPSYISGDSTNENKICNWQNNQCTDVTSSPCSSYTTKNSCPNMVDNVLCDWINSQCIQTGTAGNCSKWYSQEDCETFTDDYGNTCYWEYGVGCKNATGYECSAYTSRAECNKGKDSNGNKCLWNISGICEIEDPNALG